VSNGRKSDERSVYRIRVEGRVDPAWSGWFNDFTVIPQTNGEALLIGPVADQAALHGLLAKIRDLGLPLVSLHRVVEPPEDAGDRGTRHSAPGETLR
jgi:hypothetical protein